MFIWDMFMSLSGIFSKLIYYYSYKVQKIRDSGVAKVFFFVQQSHPTPIGLPLTLTFHIRGLSVLFIKIIKPNKNPKSITI